MPQSGGSKHDEKKGTRQVTTSHHAEKPTTGNQQITHARGHQWYKQQQCHLPQLMIKHSHLLCHPGLSQDPELISDEIQSFRSSIQGWYVLESKTHTHVGRQEPSFD